MRFRPKIGNHDFLSKVRKVKELINDGSKVKVAVVFRGREITHPERGFTLLKRVADEVQEEAHLESPPGMEGRSVTIMLAPGIRKSVKKVAQVGADAEDQDAQGS